MSSLAAPRCRHIKVNGTQCGSPALRKKNFCFYHQQNRWRGQRLAPAAKTFRPAPSRPVIAQDQKRRIALAKVTRDASNM